ncbi:MAG: type IV pilus modification PilV family protein [Gemmatimonadales bacterium]
MGNRERGVALLEVLVAVAILGVAGIGLLELVGAGTRAVAEARVRERELADEERLLAAYTLLARGDLDRRLGRRMVGPYIADVQRPERTLYRIALIRTETADVEDLVTVVYRPDPPRAP